MRSRVFFARVHIFLILASVALPSAGCAGGANNARLSKPPQIPPQSTFVMDFSDFTQSKSSFGPVRPTVSLVSLCIRTQFLHLLP